VILKFVIVAFIFGHFHIDESKLIYDSKTKLRLVQANIKQEMKWDSYEKYKNFLKHIALTNSKDTKDIKAVIWGETSVPYVIDDNPELLRNLGYAVPSDGVLITGGLRLKYADHNHEKISNAWNSVFVISKSGVTQHYDKHHLVPFGEYVPLQKFLPFIDKITGGGEGFSQGEGPQTLVTENFSFSPLVCYEVIFSGETINKEQHPDLLVNLTNDAWFGRSSGPYQHFDMAIMRSIEYGIAMVRVAGTGISAFIDPFGRVVKKINLNEEGIVDVELIKNSGTTIYATYGHLPLILLVAAILFLLTFSPRKKHDTRQNHPN
jgi:apolipoprotein N-acyltransferase